jgi:integrase/recombinase XerD
MITLQSALDDYRALRRALGFELRLAGRLLQRFVDFAEQGGASYITTQLALQWATQPAHVQSAQLANRLGMVRRFAQYCKSIDPRTIVPPQDLLPYRVTRPSPYIFSDEEIRQPIQAARALPPQAGLRPHTYSTLFALYAVTGMRTNEPLGLDRDDVDFANTVLTVRGTKFGNLATYRYTRPRSAPCDVMPRIVTSYVPHRKAQVSFSPRMGRA